MPSVITTLIDGEDAFEIIRSQIAAILVVELAEQRNLATADGKDPTRWELDVYEERTNAFEAWLEKPVASRPIVNVWFESYSSSESGSTVRNEKGQGVFNLDCYGYGVSANVPGGGHLPGDELAAKEAQRAARLCRRIMMAEHYTYLGSPRGAAQFVFSRRVQRIEMFQPEIALKAGQNVVGARLSLEVNFKNEIPQIQGMEFDLIRTSVRRGEDGKVLARADYSLA